MTYYKPGDHNIICDRTGFKLKRSQCRTEWNGLLVRKESWEPRHPQDLIRSIPDNQAVPAGEANPWPDDDYFLDTNEVQASDL